MDFTISCDCGTEIQVSEGSAGASTTCQCGRIVQVPSLARLRSIVGMSAFDIGPEFEIQHQFASRALPLPGCLLCGSHDATPTCFVANCEQLYNKHSGGISWVMTFLSLLVLPASWVFMTESPTTEIHGRDTVIPLPVCVCEQCRTRQFRAPPVSLLKWSGLLSFLFGLCLFLVDWTFAIAMLACGLSLRICASALYQRHQGFLKRSLERVPVYKQLFKKYPDAIVTTQTD